ncbi:MAG: hypothetical protein CFH28_00956, partial [Alphaproteobacteria bacterium MarineAlpha6_Bin6]
KSLKKKNQYFQSIIFINQVDIHQKKVFNKSFFKNVKKTTIRRLD